MTEQANKPTVEVIDVGLRTPPLQMPDTSSTAEDVLVKALARSAKRMRLDNSQAVREELKRGNALAFHYTRHELACQVAQALAALDRHIKAMYVFEDYATPDDLVFAEAAPTLSVSLIAWVERKTQALTVLAQGLDRALAERCGAIIGMDSLAHVLDVQAVDDHDVDTRTGYGALLTSVHHPPVQIWKR